jgi:uncharacterized short protein YbdD (DUF466 family)
MVLGRLRSAWSGISQIGNVVRRIVGIPDYDAYVAHQRTHHPDAEPLSRDEFLRKCWDEKYSRPGHRCC